MNNDLQLLIFILLWSMGKLCSSLTIGATLKSPGENNMNLLRTLSAPVGRLLIAFIFLISGFNKIIAYTNTQGYMETSGVPGELLPLVIILELLAGLAIITGWQIRLAALALAGFSISSALTFRIKCSSSCS